MCTEGGSSTDDFLSRKNRKQGFATNFTMSLRTRRHHFHWYNERLLLNSYETAGGVNIENRKDNKYTLGAGFHIRKFKFCWFLLLHSRIEEIKIRATPYGTSTGIEGM